MYQQNLRLLLVDDDAEDLGFLQFSLAGLVPQAEIFAFTDATEALKHTLDDAAPLPDMVVVDYNMPRINGLEFIKRLRILPQFKSVPVIMYSTDIRHITATDSTEYNFLPLNKGNTLEQLESSCNTMLSWLQSTQQSPSSAVK